MTSLLLPTEEPPRSTALALQARRVARRTALPILTGIAAGAISHQGGAAALGHLVQQIGFAEALVVTGVTGIMGAVWGGVREAKAIGKAAIPRFDAFLHVSSEQARASAATTQLLRDADERARQERAEQATRLEEMAEMGERVHADLADGLRRCEADARKAAEAAESARAEVVRLSERFGAGLERAVAIADRAATDAARAAQVCEALAREFQLQSIVPAVVHPVPRTP